MLDNNEETLILDAVEQFLRRDVRPYVRELEAADEYPALIADKMAVKLILLSWAAEDTLSSRWCQS